MRSLTYLPRENPNPANGIVTIDFDSNLPTQTIEIYDLLGKKMVDKIFNTNTGTWNFDTTQLAKGFYVIVQKSKTAIIVQQKLIVN